MRHMGTTAALPPGDRTVPIVGHFFEFIANLREFVMTRKAKYGDIWHSHVYGRRTAWISRPEHNEWLFRSEGVDVVKNWPRSWKRLSGESAQTVTADLEVHATQMAEMKRSAAPRDTWVPVMQRMIREHLEQWAGQDQVAVNRAAKVLALHVSTKLFFGRDMSVAQCSRLFDSYQGFVDGFSSMVTRDLPFLSFRRALRGRRAMHRFIKDALAAHDRRAAPACPVTKLRAAIGARGGRSGELYDQAQIMFYAGHEFPGTGAVLLCRALAEHPQIAERIRDELASGADSEAARELTTLAEVSRHPYLWATVQEALRMGPPVPGGYRQLIRDVVLDGFRLPKGWLVKFEPFLSHFDERYWQRPEQFDPERFLEPRAEHRKTPYAYLPFGGGVRKCPGRHYGQLFMAIFAAEASRYHITLRGQPRRSPYGHLYEPQLRITVRPRVCPG